MHGYMMLCDFAEELNGKLYIMGGGFSRLFAVTPRFSFSVAAKLLVPWTDTNVRHQVQLSLVTADGEQVSVGDPSRPVVIAGELEVGRPPGLPQGTEIDCPIVYRLEDLELAPERYRLELSVDGQQVADAVLDVVAP